MKYNVITEKENNLYDETTIKRMLDNLNFFIVKPTEATVTLKENFLMVDIVMNNKEKIKYMMREIKNRRIFHFGGYEDAADKVYSYTETEGMDGALQGYIRIYPYYVEREFYIGNQRYVESSAGSPGHFLREALLDKYKKKLNV